MGSVKEEDAKNNNSRQNLCQLARITVSPVLPNDSQRRP